MQQRTPVEYEIDKSTPVKVYEPMRREDAFVLKYMSKHNQQRFSMKHKITVVLCVIIIFVVGALTVSSYKNYQSWKSEQNAKAVAADQAEAHKSALQQGIFNAEVKGLEDQCAKDKAAYAALTPAVKVKTVAPQCDVNLAQ
jgi:predicted negative regulator of RcsB-dependent stress response